MTTLSMKINDLGGPNPLKIDLNGVKNQKKYDTCAWTPNKVFIHFLLVSVETARVLLQSWWARLSIGASREAPVDNECLGKCRQVGGDGRRREILIGYWQLG